jgi:divalent metal cation (Fe/Co/Zn/Cd) transporter
LSIARRVWLAIRFTRWLVTFFSIPATDCSLPSALPTRTKAFWGILIGAAAKVGMPILAGYKLKVAPPLNSRALRADAIESITCGYLSIVLMVALAATRLLGW